MTPNDDAPTNASVVPTLTSARESLYRSRLLFHANDVLPPTFDPVLHKAAISRKLRARGLRFRGDEDEDCLKGSGGVSATVRAMHELREEAFRSAGVGDASGGDETGNGKRRRSDGAGTALVAVDASAARSTSTGRSKRRGLRKADARGTLIVHRESDASGAPVADVDDGDRDERGLSELSSNRRRILKSSSGSGANVSVPTPKWHAPWRLASVLSSHLGWVRSVAFDPTTNDMFATGGADRVIKIFDLPKASVGAEDALRITLTGHVGPVRGMAFSPRHPYLFSAGEDKQVKCWDLETNQVVRHYHGHLSGVCCLALHPTLDVLVTGGRDAVARVWDMRTKLQIHCLSGHDHTVATVLANSTDPQIITGSHDATIRLWDLAAGKSLTTLTHHKKSVRALCKPSFESTFVSADADGLRKWRCRDGRFLRRFLRDDDDGVVDRRKSAEIVNALAVNDDGVVVSGGDDGTLRFWDHGSGRCFQNTATVAQPGSLDAENGVYAAAFDGTGTRLVTCEADKTVKIWREDETATEESHPIDAAAWRRRCLKEAKRRH